MKKLVRCPICKLPEILYYVKYRKGYGLLSGPSNQSQGPAKQPRLKRWCQGICESILTPLELEIDSLGGLIKRLKRKGVLRLAKEFRKRLKRIAKSYRAEFLFDAQKRHKVTGGR